MRPLPNHPVRGRLLGELEGSLPRGLLAGRRERDPADRAPCRRTELGRGGAGLHGTTVRPVHRRPQETKSATSLCGRKCARSTPGTFPSTWSTARTRERRGRDPPHGHELGADLIVMGTHGSTRAAPAAGRERGHRRHARGPLPGPGSPLWHDRPRPSEVSASSSIPRTSRTASEAALQRRAIACPGRGCPADHPARLPHSRVGRCRRTARLSVLPWSSPRAHRWPGPQVPRGDLAQPGQCRRRDPPHSRRDRLRPDRHGHARADRTGPPPDGQRRRIRPARGDLPSDGRQDSPRPHRRRPRIDPQPGPQP